MLGDSHIHAIKEALEARGPASAAPFRIEARRLFKIKEISAPGEATPQRRRPWFFGRTRRDRQTRALVGDISAREALRILRSLGPDDVLVSVIGGNQHAVFSTIQHPQPFDFILSGENKADAPADGAEIIPFRTLYEYFRSSLRNNDGETVAELRRSTAARVVHLLTPPPKRENEWIEQHHDTFFAREGIAASGVSPPALRMKFWRLQNRAIEAICGELGVEVLGPPESACDPDGFLLRDYYAGDATHANARYGELVLQQLESRFGDDERRERAA